MRDGKKIAVDILKVTDGKKYPVILELTPYGRYFLYYYFWNSILKTFIIYIYTYLKRGPEGFNFRNEVEFWFQNGYMFVIGDCRGTGDSEGQMVFFAAEGEDLFDLIDWWDWVWVCLRGQCGLLLKIGPRMHLKANLALKLQSLKRGSFQGTFINDDT